MALAAEENLAITQNLLMETAAMIKPVSSGKKDDCGNCFPLFGWWK
jgi:hypothetical protein